YLFFKESFKGELFVSNRIDFEKTMSDLEYQNSSSRPNFAEFMSLMREKRKRDDFLKTSIKNNDSEEFVQYLKQHSTKRELLE
ncbi:MAG TPA: hypothetical protein PLD88_10310, partial [Candidatus Berkiella sp.]|nr:hypothetical protein [Candidatus Berkiella sp.]